MRATKIPTLRNTTEKSGDPIRHLVSHGVVAGHSYCLGEPHEEPKASLLGLRVDHPCAIVLANDKMRVGMLVVKVRSGHRSH